MTLFQSMLKNFLIKYRTYLQNIQHPIIILDKIKLSSNNVQNKHREYCIPVPETRIRRDPDLGLQTQTKVDPNPGSRHGQKSYQKAKKIRRKN